MPRPTYPPAPPGEPSPPRVRGMAELAELARPGQQPRPPRAPGWVQERARILPDPTRPARAKATVGSAALQAPGAARKQRWAQNWRRGWSIDRPNTAIRSVRTDPVASRVGSWSLRASSRAPQELWAQLQDFGTPR